MSFFIVTLKYSHICFPYIFTISNLAPPAAQINTSAEIGAREPPPLSYKYRENYKGQIFTQLRKEVATFF